MKIKRFNESLNKKYLPTDKILKVSVDDFEVKVNKIRATEKYIKNLDMQYGKHSEINDWKTDELFYGLEEWIYTSGDLNFTYKLYDGNGNIIENEEEFDNYVKNMKKFNL